MHSFRSDLFFVFCLASFLAGLDLAESCCQELVFESTGSTASGANNHVIGHYEIHSDGPDGRVTYLQTDNKFGDMYLYWYPPLTRWYIGGEPDKNLGYAYNLDSTAKCVEDVSETWVWWDFVNGQWTEDDAAKFKCLETTEELTEETKGH